MNWCTSLSIPLLLRASLLSLMALTSGCFFDQLQRSEEGDIRRVEQKQVTLQGQQDRAATLQREKEQLTTELSERQVTLDELNDRVQQINAQNGHALADNESARRQYDLYLQRLHETNEQLAVAQKGGGAGTIEERRKRIESLQAQLKDQLDSVLR